MRRSVAADNRWKRGARGLEVVAWPVGSGCARRSGCWRGARLEVLRRVPRHLRRHGGRRRWPGPAARRRTAHAAAAGTGATGLQFLWSRAGGQKSQNRGVRQHGNLRLQLAGQGLRQHRRSPCGHGAWCMPSPASAAARAASSTAQAMPTSSNEGLRPAHRRATRCRAWAARLRAIGPRWRRARGPAPGRLQDFQVRAAQRHAASAMVTTPLRRWRTVGLSRAGGGGWALA